MLKHNFLIIFRNFIRSKSTFFINLIGLSTGLAFALLIYLWVNDELNVDKFNKNDGKLYQVMENARLTDGVITQPYTPDLLAETIAEEIPEIEYAAGVTPSSWFGFTLTFNETKVKGVGQFAGKDFFKIFSFDLLQGNPDQILIDKNTVVISEELAKKLFNTTENVVGKTINWQLLSYKEQAMISGIYKDVPENSTMKFQFVLPYQAWKDFSKEIERNINWDNHGPSTFVTLKEGTNINDFNKKIAEFIKSKNKNSNVTLFARSYSDGYLFNKYENGIQSGGRIEYVKLFSVIALFLILIACINFMNLSTAKASGRLKEVGIKKTIGADRKSLIIQYMSESVIISLISLAVAIVLVELLLPRFNQIIDKNLSLNSNIIIPFIGIALITGLLSGSYPALYLSSISPITMLKGKLSRATGELWIRKGLVIFQFSLSILFIVAVLVVYNQIEFIQSKNLGYNKDNVIYFEKDGNIVKNEETFLKELKKVPGVLNASSSASTIVGSYSSTEGLRWEGKNPEETLRFEFLPVNYDFIETLGIKMEEGRSYSRDFSSEDTKIIFNESAIKAMGLKNPIGKVVNLWGNEKQIIGIMKNFNFESFHENIKPLLLVLIPQYATKIMVKIHGGKEGEVIDKIKKLYAEFNQGVPFDYNFLDKEYQALYESEQRVSALSKYFAGLAILISCLGLLGLAAFTAQKRRKEIGIRKVLGSSEFGIIYLLSVDFTKLIIASLVIALPISYYLTKNWLDTFAYRIDLSVWYFVIAGVITLVIAWLTVGIQAIKAASANPVKSLRYE